MYLPPFSPDYSGVSSVLFDLKTVTAMHDASGCTGNYTGYDEPRWYGSQSAIYCSGLREIDAVLGDDEKLIKKMIAAAEDLNPDLLALVGSPVPMVVGSDLAGIAAELEQRTGIPSFGFDTTGTAYYDKGAALAVTALLERFAPVTESIPGTVNLVGATPMDFGTEEVLKELQKAVITRGFSITACLSMGYTLDQLRQAGSAQVNLAVSRTGLMIARRMEKQYGIPYLCGLPIGERGARSYFSALEQVMATRKSKELTGSACGDPKILIIGEQVRSNAIRLAIESLSGEKSAVGCLFGAEACLTLPQDKDLKMERQICEEINRPDYHIVIADPFLQPLLTNPDTIFLINPQFAVSSYLGARHTVPLMGNFFDKWLAKANQRKKELL